MLQRMKSLSTAQSLVLTLLALGFVGCGDPQTAQECIDLAMDHFNRQKYSSSLRLCNKAVELEPSNYDGYNMRAMVLATLGNTQQAIADCTKAIELAPDDDTKSGMYLLRSQVYQVIGDRVNMVKDRIEAERLELETKQGH